MGPLLGSRQMRAVMPCSSRVLREFPAWVSPRRREGVMREMGGRGVGGGGDGGFGSGMDVVVEVDIVVMVRGVEVEVVVGEGGAVVTIVMEAGSSVSPIITQVKSLNTSRVCLFIRCYLAGCRWEG